MPQESCMNDFVKKWKSWPWHGRRRWLKNINRCSIIVRMWKDPSWDSIQNKIQIVFSKWLLLRIRGHKTVSWWKETYWRDSYRRSIIGQLLLATLQTRCLLVIVIGKRYEQTYQLLASTPHPDAQSPFWLPLSVIRCIVW